MAPEHTKAQIGTENKPADADIAAPRKTDAAPPQLSLQQLVGNQAASQLSQQNMSPAAPAPEPVVIHLYESHPWQFTVDGAPDPVAICNELYGIDLSRAPDVAASLVPPADTFFGPKRYEAIPDMMLPKYQAQFHAAMRRELEKDVNHIEDILFELRIDGDDEAEMINLVRWWSKRRDLRDQGGRSYFDAFLSKLKNNQWYRDYGVRKGASHSFLDTLYEEVEERAGELNTIIAQNSREFGAYQPPWALLGQGEQTQDTVNKDLVNRSADLVLDKLKWYTSEDDSKIITDALVGLAPREKAAVLKAIMDRYDERDWMGLGRYGEGWEGGMLFWLFEDLEDEDRDRLAANVKASGVMKPEAVDAFAAGRSFIGRNLPWTTHHITRIGKETAEWYADIAANSESGAKRFGAKIGLAFAVLITPEVYDTTLTTFVTAGFGAGLARAPGFAQSLLGRGMLVTGTGISAYTTTIAVGELITGRDAYSGEALSDTDKLSRVLHAASGVLFLTAGFMQAKALTPSVQSPPTNALVRTGPTMPSAPAGGAGGAASSAEVQYRIVSLDPQTGEAVILGQHMATNEYAVFRLNMRTGMGTAAHLGTGDIVPIEGWQLGQPRLALAGTTSAPPAGSPGTGALAPGAPTAIASTSISTEADIVALINDTNPAFPLTRVNALRALWLGRPGSVPQVAGPRGEGADVTATLRSPEGVIRSRVEVKSIAGGAQGTFNTEVGHAAEQVQFGGSILVQVPQATTPEEALRIVLRFRGARLRAGTAELGKYRSVQIIIVNPNGDILFEGPLAL